MRDAQDAMRQAGHSRAAEVLALLGDADALEADATSARIGRRRRSLLRGGAASIAVVAVAASFLTLRPPPPMPLMQAADGMVGDAAIMRLDDQLRGMCDMGLEPTPHVPLADPGVAIASEDVRDLGIEMDARVVRLTWGTTVALSDVPVDGAITVDGAPGARESMTATVITVSWPGDALYDVSAAGYLVAGDRLISDISGWPMALTDNSAVEWMGYNAVPAYDRATDRSSISHLSYLEPMCLGALGASWGTGDEWPYSAPDIPTSLHTFVQVRDESGVPLVTNQDALGWAETLVEFPGYEEAGKVAKVTPLTPEELLAAEEEAAAAIPQVPHASLAAKVRDETARVGEPLTEVGTGVRLLAPCAATAEALKASGGVLTVVPTDAEPLGFPGELPLEVVVGDDQWGIADEDAEFPEEGSYWTQSAQMVFLDTVTGEVATVFGATVDFATDDTTGEMTDVAGLSRDTAVDCGPAPDVDPGTYRVLMAMEYVGYPVAGIDEVGGSLYGYVASWVDVGDVTLTE
ncbi:MAG: hypothetical protein ACK5IM_11230 [Demequina sp.]|uniref:hypothetical protein n=1 Tax=Demequina sp. TaxID=2050685 RepID=UPI003A88C972